MDCVAGLIGGLLGIADVFLHICRTHMPIVHILTGKGNRIRLTDGRTAPILLPPRIDTDIRSLHILNRIDIGRQARPRNLVHLRLKLSRLIAGMPMVAIFEVRVCRRYCYFRVERVVVVCTG